MTLKAPKRLTFALVILFYFSCSKEQTDAPTNNLIFSVDQDIINQNQTEYRANGVNTLNTFGISNREEIQNWNIKIVREFIGNLREQPLSGFAIQDSAGSFLHSLQNIVDANRNSGLVTILCPFGWVDTEGNQTLFTGKNPKSQSFYEDYTDRMKAIAQQFKNQPDVWIEVWNEPYHFNNENGYSNELWLNDMADMIDNLRSVDGFTNIIVVPGNEQGQSETAILEKGGELLSNRHNIIFDVHAYEKWLLNSTQMDITTRINTINQAGFCFIFGEVGVINTSGLMPLEPFLVSVTNTETITLAWLFNRNTEDQNSLLTDDGLANDTNNNNWGTTYKTFLSN